MSNHPIWDSHVHLFPEEIFRNWEKYAAKDSWFALLTKKPETGKGTEEAWATVDEALDSADMAGIYGLAMQGWYWNDPGLMRLHNDYMADAKRRHPDRLVAFASINPKFGEQALAEIERCRSMGFSGIGELGPGGNGYDFLDPDFFTVLECANHYHLPVCIHCGEPVGHVYAGKDTTSLAPLPDLARHFPDLKLILAHLGGGLPFYSMNPKLGDGMGNVYYDTAANPLLYAIRSIKTVISMVGADKLLYGSDFPLLLYPSKCRKMDFSMFLSDIKENAMLSEKESDLFLSDNFRKLLTLR